MRLRLKGINSRNLPAHPEVIVGARAKNRFRKLIGITGTRFTRKRKRRSGNWVDRTGMAVVRRGQPRPIGLLSEALPGFRPCCTLVECTNLLGRPIQTNRACYGGIGQATPKRQRPPPGPPWPQRRASKKPMNWNRVKSWRVKPVADQCSLKTPSTSLISAGLMRRECATVTECRTPSSDFCQNPKKPCNSGKSG